MTTTTPKPKRTKAEEAERSAVVWLIFAVVVVSLIPQLLGYAGTPPGGMFIGTPYNIDDYCVYLSWIHQTAGGHLLIRNLFTTDPQPTLPFYILFSLIGAVVRVTHLSAQIVLLLTRLIGGVGLLALIYRFYKACLPDNREARVTAFALTCLGSGFGWVSYARIWHDKNNGGPVDAWQPEAYTFLSIYLEALFVVATLLIVGTMYAMLVCARTGKTRYAVIAGICVALLANFHSYDIFHIIGAWGLFMIVWTIYTLSCSEERAGERSKTDTPTNRDATSTRTSGSSRLVRLWLQSILALAMAMPTTLYNLHVLNTNPVFKARAQSSASSPPLDQYVTGYGVEFICAVAAIVFLTLRGKPPAKGLLFFRPPIIGAGGPTNAPVASELSASSPTDAPSSHLPSPQRRGAGGEGWADRAAIILAVCWAIVPLALVELDRVHFLTGKMQWRKMLMGEHIPLCLLAGWGAVQLFSRLSGPTRRAALAAVVLLSLPSNVLFVVRDIHHLESHSSETYEWPYLDHYQVQSLDWIDHNVPANQAIVGPSFYCLYVAALTGRAVWAGHWSETPDIGRKFTEFNRFADTTTPDDERRAFLASTRAQYLYYPTELTQESITDKNGITHTYADFAAHPPPYLTPVFTNKEIDIFRIDLSR